MHRKSRITIIIEKAKNNYSAYLPEFPGCVATGKTEAETKKNIIEAFKFHLEGLEMEKMSKPKPSAKVKFAYI
jgi:predicted RNase H-like HicB family nuclease